MYVTWLGQAGLLFENENIKIIIDPYMSDSCHKVNPKSFRRTPIDESYFNIKPDVLICTHDHLDHYDPESLVHFLGDGSCLTYLGGSGTYMKARENFGGSNNYVLFDRHTSWTEKGVTFTAVKAEHSEKYAIGVIIDDGCKKYYVSGDTLYNTEIFQDLPNDIDVAFIPVNGVGNNMNAVDAVKFADKVGAKTTVPLHFGMFDEKTSDIFEYDKKTVLSVYKKTEI